LENKLDIALFFNAFFGIIHITILLKAALLPFTLINEFFLVKFDNDTLLSPAAT